MLHPGVSFDAPHAPLYSLFIALQDVIPEMGPTCFVLGTHDRASHDTFPMTKWGDEQFCALVEKKCCTPTLRKGRRRVVRRAHVSSRWGERIRASRLADSDVSQTTDSDGADAPKRERGVERQRRRVRRPMDAR